MNSNIQAHSDTQASADLSHIARMIDGIHIAMMTTADSAGGALSSRPMALLEMDHAGAFWFFTDQRSAKLDQLQDVNLAFVDTGRGLYVSLSGHGEIETDRSHIDAYWTPMAKPWFPDGPSSPTLALLKFLPHSAEYWEASSSRMVRVFSLVASAVTGKPVAMGEHGVLSGLAAHT